MGDWTPKDRPFSELGQRLLSAAVLIPSALAMVWFGGVWLALGCAVFAGVMAYEWAQMTGFRAWHLLSFLAASIPFATWWYGLNGGGIALCGAMAVALLASFFDTEYERSRIMVPFGILYVSSMATALFVLREGAWDGRVAALMFMSFVWASDAGAYFAGRGFGGPKLLPKESPNKTWAGAIGAIIVTVLCGAIAAGLTKSSYAAWLALGFSITVMAQAGDLFESGLKRRFGVKDSSQIIPGHGGVLDRVDGLGIVCVSTVLALLLIPELSEALGL